MLSDEDIRERVRFCLLDTSNDDCWISATSAHAINRVAEMVKKAIADSRDPDAGAPWTVDGLID